MISSGKSLKVSGGDGGSDSATDTFVAVDGLLNTFPAPIFVFEVIPISIYRLHRFFESEEIV